MLCFPPFFFRLDLRLDLCNYFRELFFTFLSCFRIDVVAFPLAVRIGRRVPSLIEVVVNHGDTTRPGTPYFGLVRREFDRGGLFLYSRFSVGIRASVPPILRSIYTAACLCIVSVIWL